MKRYLLLYLASISLQAAAQINSGDLITKNKYYEVVLSDIIREIRLQASLHGDEYDFMLDTGAPAFISKEMQDKYQFKYMMRGKAKDAGGKKVRTDIVLIDTIKVGPFIFTNIPTLVLDIKNSPLACYNLAGNIGSNILRHLVVQFDIRNNTVALTDNEQLLKQHLTGVKPMRINAQSDVFIPVTIDGSFTDTIHYDSGDGQLYEISKKAADVYAGKYASDIIRRGYGTLSMGIGGMAEFFQQYVFKPINMEIAGQKIKGGTICIAGNNRSRMGRELLNYGILQLNYIDSTFAFQPYTTPYVPNNFDYGFKVMPDEDAVIACCVWEGGEAAKQGMESGDEILKINDIEFATLSKCDIETALRKEHNRNVPSTTVTFRHKKQPPKTIILPKSTL